ncbi:MAG: hypothetical protein K0R84_659 [Clostridia bacterium]|nr:hypothetical protein [Clostridia bacterium]
MKFNRGCVAYIDNKRVTVYSYDAINKMMDNPLNVKNDILTLEMSKEISEYLYNRSKNNEVNLKISSSYLPDYYLVDVNLILECLSSYENDKIMDNYKIKQCQDNNKVTNEELLINASKIYKGNFVLLKDSNYCIVHRKSHGEYYYKDEINISSNLYDRIKYYLRILRNSNNNSEIQTKLCYIIKNEFEYDFNKNNNKINYNLWKRLDMNCDFEVIY